MRKNFSRLELETGSIGKQQDVRRASRRKNLTASHVGKEVRRHREMIFEEVLVLEPEAPLGRFMSKVTGRPGKTRQTKSVRLRYQQVARVIEKYDWEQLDNEWKFEPMRPRRRYDEKRVDISCGSLNRWLRAHVGQDWGKVGGKLLGNGISDARRHLMESAIRELVLTNVLLSDGRLLTPRGEPIEQRHFAHFNFFVHPGSGTLQLIDRSGPRSRTEPASRYEQVVVNEHLRLVQVDGIWYWVELKAIPMLEDLPTRKHGNFSMRTQMSMPPQVREMSFYRQIPRDAVLKLAAFDDARLGDKLADGSRLNYGLTPLIQEWGAKLYAAEKWQASKDELKRHGISG